MSGSPELPLGLTKDDIIEACNRRLASLDNPGFCLACGEEVEGVEPDARGYKCPMCDEDRVFGAEEILLMLV